MNLADEIFALFRTRGSSAYLGEGVSVTEHALQAAHFARAAAAPQALVIAALLHDIGHLVAPVPEDLADWTVDARHQEIGSAWLASRFPPEVSEPVRLHVAAKRYLCRADARYVSQLSSASVVTLELQGGPMSAAEAANFETESYHADSIRVRRWDDQGKIPDLPAAPLEAYRAWILELGARCPRAATASKPMAAKTTG
jgi:gamma-butyrobetaine dioxygenase